MQIHKTRTCVRRYLWEVVRAIMEGVRNPVDAGERIGSAKQQRAEEMGLQGLHLLQACTRRLAAYVAAHPEAQAPPKQTQAAAAAAQQQQLQQLQQQQQQQGPGDAAAAAGKSHPVSAKLLGALGCRVGVRLSCTHGTAGLAHMLLHTWCRSCTHCLVHMLLHTWSCTHGAGLAHMVPVLHTWYRCCTHGAGLAHMVQVSHTWPCTHGAGLAHMVPLGVRASCVQTISMLKKASTGFLYRAPHACLHAAKTRMY